MISIFRQKTNDRHTIGEWPVIRLSSHCRRIRLRGFRGSFVVIILERRLLYNRCVHDSDLTRARRELSNFNRNSNLLIAGTEFAVADDPAVARVLREFGAIVTDLPTPTTRLIWDQATATIAGAGEFTEPDTIDISKPLPLRPAAERVGWARRFMPVSAATAADLGDDIGELRIGVVLILEPKTAVLALLLKNAGAQVAVFAPANETDRDVANYLMEQGIAVFADADASAARERELAESFLDWHPELLIDDGAHLIRRAHQRPDVMEHLRGGAEETTSGIRPLRSMEADGALHIPVIAVNNARSKTLFDNRFGTGQTCAFAVYDRVPEASRRWLVIGFGPVGAGLAQCARALGAEVTVAEVDPVRALEARCSGYPVAPIDLALSSTDVVISATGIPRTITQEHLQAAEPGTVFAVAGGVPHEIEPGDLPQHIRVLADGHGINYTAAEGNPIEIMDLSFAAQLAALKQLVTNRPAPGIHPLDDKADRRIAARALEAAGAAPEPDTTTRRKQASAWKNDRYRAAAEAVVFSAALVIPVTAPSIMNGAVAVKDGRIVHVGQRRWVLQALRDEGQAFTEQHWPGVITPGLVNAHTHLQYTDMEQIGRSHYLGFDDWARAFDAVYDHREFDWLASAMRGTELAIASGTTACADVVTDREAADALSRSGMHGIAYWEVMGWSNEGWRAKGRDQAIADLRQIPPQPGVGVSPHAPYSLGVQPLLDIPDLVRGLGMRLHIHLGEAHFERETRPAPGWPGLEAPSFQDLRRSGVGVSSTQFVDQLGVLGPDCHIAHGVYLSTEDRALLRARGTSVALCPRSNEVIGLDAPPVAAYLREGNQISVGTDSLSSSPSLDLLDDVAVLYRIAREQGYADADLHGRLLAAATLGGAGSLGLRAGKARAGQLSVGAMADLAFFDVNSTGPSEALAELVEAGAGTCRRTVIAGQTRYLAKEDS